MSKNKSAAANKKYESESDSFDDEPIPRKKTRATNDLTNKKNDDKHNDKRLSSDKKIASQPPPRKETRSSHSERKTGNSSQRDKSASQDPKNKSKLQQKLDNKRGVPNKNEKSKPVIDEPKGKKPINAKRTRSVEKESPKDKGKGDKKQGSGKKDEKHEKNDKRGDKGHKNEKNEKHDKHDKNEKEDRDRSSRSDARRKKEKEEEKVSVEKDEKRQTRADKAQEAKDVKKLQTKQQTEKEKQMADFTKKYPQYVLRGKFKFPIEDRLFDMYSSILEEHLPEVKRPKPRAGFIPAKDLGDILQIWNFFASFPELFKFEDIEKEEIYAGLKYSGEECLGLLNDMHQGILSLYLLEFIKKNRFETSRDETDHPFFVLIKYQTGNITQHGDELAIIWTEFANQLAAIPPFGDHYTETLKRYFKNLATKTCLHYNKLEYKQKIKILLNLIEGVYETDLFKDFLQSRMDATSAIIKERNDLNNEIKQDEQEFIALKAKLAQAQKGVKKADSFRGNSSTRLESLRRPRNAADNTKHDVIQRYTDELNVLEELINKKQETVDAINSELVMTLQTATFLGVDGDKTEYWVFQAEPDRVYIRNPSIMSTDEEWFYYNTKADILALVDSLNTKGIKESQLQEQLLDLIEDGTIIFDEDELEEEKEEEVQAPKRRGRPKKKTEEEDIAEEEAQAKPKKGGRMEVEDEEDDDDDGYVVRKKDNGEANKNKETPIPIPVPVPVVAEEKIGDEMNVEKPETTTENAENPVEEKKEAGEHQVEEEIQKVEEPVEEEKTIEETKENIEKIKHDEREIARLKELEIEREKEQERIRERERAREERLQRLQRKLQEANSELNFDYWFSKVLEYQVPEAPEEEEVVAVAPATNIEENPNEPQSADKPAEEVEPTATAPIQMLTAKKKSPQDLNLDFIKRMLLETEEYLTTYLVKWEARWAHPDIRKDLIHDLKEAKTIEELRPVLLKLNEFFQYSETPRGRRGRPVRNKSNEEKEEGEGDNMEEEDEENEDDWGSKKSDDEGAEIEEEEKVNPETENAGDTEIRAEKEDADKEQKSSATKGDKPPGMKTEQVKKMPLKFWGAFTSRLKKSWATYTADADNIGAIYFATSLLCETVNVYVEKKNARYFTEYKTGKEYLAAKKRQKEEAYEQRAEAEAAIEAAHETKNAPVQAPRDYLDRSSRQTRTARGPVTRGYRYNDNRYVVDDDSQEKSSTESDSMVSRLRKRTRRPPKFPDEIYTRKPNKAQEALRLRQQQERLEELANLRRSTRISNQFRKKYTSLDEQQWYKECKVCLKSDGDFITCVNCSDNYHPVCIGYDNTQPMPEEGWTCGPCVEHIANSRQTRSSARRVQL